MEIEETDYEILDTDDPQGEHWRGLQPDLIDRLLIRRSLVRAQVGEPIKSKGYVARRNPFLFAILDSGLSPSMQLYVRLGALRDQPRQRVQRNLPESVQS